LLARLDAIPPGGLGVVIGSAGSGKSTLVQQWVATRRERVVPVQVGGSHHGTSSLADQLDLALASVTHDIVDPTVLVIEDLHLLQDPAGSATLLGLLDAAPDALRVVVTARWGPPFPLNEHRLRGNVVELRSGDLAFAVDEADQLLQAVSGRHLTADQVATLTRRTDGWAAGLHLAGLSLRTAPDLDAFVDAFAGDDRLVAEYLTAEVLDGLPDDLRHFLLATATLDELTPSLCDTVIPHGARLLAETERLDLFLTAADERRERFRYHPLFVDLLRLTARTRIPDAAASVHERAAQWYLEQRQPETAIDHLLAAGRIDLARPLIDTHGRRVWELGGSEQLFRWLERIAAALDATTLDQLTLMVAYKADDQAVGLADATRALRARVDLEPAERAIVEAYAASLGHYDVEPRHVLASALTCLALIEDLSERDVPAIMRLTDRASIELLAQGFAGLAHFYEGHLDDATDALLRSNELPGARYPRWRVHVLGSLALIRAWTGHLREAAGLADDAIALATELDQVMTPPVTSAHLALAVVALESDRIAEVTTHLDRAHAIASRAGRTADLDVLDAVRARHLALTDGPKTTLATLTSITSERSHRRLRPLQSDTRTVLEARTRLALGQVLQAKALLAELPPGTAAAGARIELALAEADLGSARLELDRWEPESTDRGARVAREAWTAAVLAAEGDQPTAIAVAAQAAAEAEVENHRRALLDVPPVLPLLRPTAQERSADFVRNVLASPRVGVTRHRSDGGDAVVEPLTERELELVQLLPSRLSNKELAAHYYVSVNTVKTHLRAIYRKLGVDNRDDAIRRATDLDLLQ
jgi:LuxR family maltose regulon positive regulatory protein